MKEVTISRLRTHDRWEERQKSTRPSSPDNRDAGVISSLLSSVSSEVQFLHYSLIISYLVSQTSDPSSGYQNILLSSLSLFPGVWEVQLDFITGVKSSASNAGFWFHLNGFVRLLPSNLKITSLSAGRPFSFNRKKINFFSSSLVASVPRGSGEAQRVQTWLLKKTWT